MASGHRRFDSSPQTCLDLDVTKLGGTTKKHFKFYWTSFTSMWRTFHAKWHEHGARIPCPDARWTDNNVKSSMLVLLPLSALSGERPLFGRLLHMFAVWFDVCVQLYSRPESGDESVNEFAANLNKWGFCTDNSIEFFALPTGRVWFLCDDVVCLKLDAICVTTDGLLLHSVAEEDVLGVHTFLIRFKHL